MTPRDARIAAFEEAAALAEYVADGFGGAAQHAARIVAARIRAQMTLELEEVEVPA